MSVSGSGFNVSGIASGLDWKSMVDQLMTIENQPVTRLQQRKATLQNKNSVFQSINSKLAGLDNAINSLLQDSTIKGKKATITTATSGSTAAGTIATASATSDTPVGSYTFLVKQLATATNVTSNGKNGGRLGAAISDASKTVSSLNFSQPVTSGKLNLVLNGTENVEVTIDTLNDTLQGVFDKISTATGGRVTAALSGDKITMTANASITSLSVGTGKDTSNFASATFLNTASFDGVAKTITSSKTVSAVSTGKAMVDSGIATGGAALASFTGKLKINGVEISYDTANDSLNNLMSAINASEANVLASYDAVNDKIMLTSKSTGATSIAIADLKADGSAWGAGEGILSQTGLLANQTLGQNAKIALSNGTSDQTTWLSLESTSNTFTNIAPGLSLTALAVSAEDSSNPGSKLSTTVKIDADLEGVKEKIKSFINEFNGIVDTIDSARAKGQPLAFDGTLNGIRSQLFSLVSGSVDGLSGSPKSFLDIGISTSKDDRNHLTLNETTFNTAFNTDPDRIAQIFNRKETVDGKTKNYGLAAKLNEYIDNLRKSDGVFKVHDNSTSSQVKAIDDSIKNLQQRLALRRTNMVRQFTAMEKMVSSLNNQRSAMMSQLSSLS